MTSNVPVTVTYGQGTSELVKLYGSSLPAKVTIDTTSGTPTFSSAIPVHIALSTPGTYPVTVNSSSPSTATQSSSFNIIVTPNANCESAIAGTYTATTNCSAVITSYWTGPSPHSVTVTSTGITNQVVMPGLISNISANLICSTGTLTTLERNNGDIDLKAGTGIFSADSMHITYDVYALGGPYLATCTTSYVR
jgi:hypothetical protein